MTLALAAAIVLLICAIPAVLDRRAHRRAMGAIEYRVNMKQAAAWDDLAAKIDDENTAYRIRANARACRREAAKYAKFA